MPTLRHRRAIGAVLAVAALAFSTMVASQPVEADQQKHFVAPLSGSEEVPPVPGNGTGVATFKVGDNGSWIQYRLIVANIEDVTQSHIHLAPAGTNGGVVAFLFGFVSGGVTSNGVLATGTITDGDLVGALDGMTIADLVAELASGNAYVNVHTVANPGGEIRGQIR